MKDPKTDQFVLDLKTIRARARSHMDDGAVTSGYRLDVDKVIQLLDDSLATELVCVLTQEEEHADELSDFLRRLAVVPER
jgi:bacterioferritin